MVSTLERKVLESQKGTKNVFSNDYGLTGGESEKHLSLLQKNHDVVLEKYETYKLEHSRLLKETEEATRQYSESQIENNKLADSNYALQRQKEDAVNAKRILESKLRNEQQMT